MSMLAKIVIGVIGAAHVYFAWMEIGLWMDKGTTFVPGASAEFLEQSWPLAKNQGVYNLFLAAGLFWSLFIPDAKYRFQVALCFLLFVLVAGVFGALTLRTYITLIAQTVPAVIGIGLLVMGRKASLS